MTANKLPILISVMVNHVDGKYYPLLRLKINDEEYPDELACKIAYPSRAQALEEASRLIEAILEANVTLQGMISVEVVEENQVYSQYAANGSLLH